MSGGAGSGGTARPSRKNNSCGSGARGGGGDAVGGGAPPRKKISCGSRERVAGVAPTLSVCSEGTAGGGGGGGGGGGDGERARFDGGAPEKQAAGSKANMAWWAWCAWCCNRSSSVRCMLA
jgi:hypothetical protein